MKKSKFKIQYVLIIIIFSMMSFGINGQNYVIRQEIMGEIEVLEEFKMEGKSGFCFDQNYSFDLDKNNSIEKLVHEIGKIEKIESIIIGMKVLNDTTKNIIHSIKIECFGDSTFNKNYILILSSEIQVEGSDEIINQYKFIDDIAIKKNFKKIQNEKVAKIFQYQESKKIQPIPIQDMSNNTVVKGNKIYYFYDENEFCDSKKFRGFIIRDINKLKESKNISIKDMINRLKLKNNLKDITISWLNPKQTKDSVNVMKFSKYKDIIKINGIAISFKYDGQFDYKIIICFDTLFIDNRNLNIDKRKNQFFNKNSKKLYKIIQNTVIDEKVKILEGLQTLPIGVPDATMEGN